MMEWWVLNHRSQGAGHREEKDIAFKLEPYALRRMPKECILSLLKKE